MLSLPDLSQAYKNSHPHYFNPLAYFDPNDQVLAAIKREAIFPYLENLEEKMVIYRERFIAFVVLLMWSVTTSDFGPMPGDSTSSIYLTMLDTLLNADAGK